MLEFTIDQNLCIRCGQCAADCPVNIIDLQSGWPAIPDRKEAACLRCQHCLAICPTAALSILGKHPADSLPLAAGDFPDPEKLARLVRGRRSVRHYSQADLDPALIRSLLETAWYAPTGHNDRGVRFTVIDQGATLARLREELLAKVAELAKTKQLPAGLEYFATFPRAWQRNQTDVVFRGAPHLLIATAPQNVTFPRHDCLIALATFELLAQASGVGTVWNGLATWFFEEIAPDWLARLGVPADHQLGCIMSFGKPAVVYPRTVQHEPADIIVADW